MSMSKREMELYRAMIKREIFMIDSLVDIIYESTLTIGSVLIQANVNLEIQGGTWKEFMKGCILTESQARKYIDFYVRKKKYLALKIENKDDYLN
jgi:hypothetical protein